MTNRHKATERLRIPYDIGEMIWRELHDDRDTKAVVWKRGIDNIAYCYIAPIAQMKAKASDYITPRRKADVIHMLKFSNFSQEEALLLYDLTVDLADISQDDRCNLKNGLVASFNLGRKASVPRQEVIDMQRVISIEIERQGRIKGILYTGINYILNKISDPFEFWKYTEDQAHEITLAILEWARFSPLNIFYFSVLGWMEEFYKIMDDKIKNSTYEDVLSSIDFHRMRIDKQLFTPAEKIKIIGEIAARRHWFLEKEKKEINALKQECEQIKNMSRGLSGRVEYLSKKLSTPTLEYIYRDTFSENNTLTMV